MKKQNSEVDKAKDPFKVLDALIPPKTPTRKVSEKEWKELTKGLSFDED